MEILEYQNIDFNALEKLSHQGRNSSLYTDGVFCYKIFNNYRALDKGKYLYKLDFLHNLDLENVLLPKEIVTDKNYLAGYTMPYFKHSINLCDKYLGRKLDVREFLKDINKISLILRKIHQENIICQDLNFTNILTDENHKIMFCDADSWNIPGASSSQYSGIYQSFMVYFRHLNLCPSQNVDKITCILQFYYYLFNEFVQNITKEKYDFLFEKLKSLQNMHKLFTTLQNKNAYLTDIPYLDELLDLNDDYFLDKQSLSRLCKSNHLQLN